MEGNRAIQIAVDIAMSLALVAVMATALVQEAPHEWLGVALFALMVAHIVLNRRWLGAIFRGRHTPLRILQICLVACLVACLIGQVASSLVLSKHAFGFLPALPGAGWARRVHMLCSYWLFVLAFAHAGLHARLPRHLTPAALWATRIALAAISCYGAYSFAKLGLLPYLAGQVPYAMADFETPLALVCARYASAGALVAVAFGLLRRALAASAPRRSAQRGATTSPERRDA